MKPTITRGATNNFQAPGNWDPAFGECGDLQVRMEVFSEDKNKLVECLSTWKPSAEELAHLNAGGVIEVGLCVLNQPVMRVGVVDPVDARLAPYLPQPTDDRPAITINEHAHGDDHHGA